MPKGVGTVAHASIDGKPMFGVNSSAPSYTQADRDAADAMRDGLIENHPGIMKTKNIGHKPNDALYHAEVTLLLRAAWEAGGNLKGRTIEMHVDRELCGS
ncbi:MAG: hypothetical protein ACKVP7_27395 [Hyphomicrobiaceae bacterium]